MTMGLMYKETHDNVTPHCSLVRVNANIVNITTMYFGISHANKLLLTIKQILIYIFP